MRGNLLIYIKDSAHAFNCSLGDQILVYCHPQIVPGPTNPGGFDYAAYLHGKGIWHQAFTDLNRITVIIKNDSYSLFTVAISLRDLLLEKLKRFINQKNSSGWSIAAWV
ncbi:MAG: DUF4131 domain-containing protein [Bacteroidetes bacterium]|nr:DUF4131 domain-containing protein [Bacteroidota bacterium]